MTGPVYLSIPDKEYSKIKTHVLAVFPQEACGLMAGLGCEISDIIPITNRLHSPTAYFMDPGDLFAGFKKIDSFGLELVGIYHSHPTGQAEPSLKDKTEAISPDIVYVILAPDRVGGGKIDQEGCWAAIVWQVRGFLIYRDQMTEIELNCG